MSLVHQLCTASAFPKSSVSLARSWHRRFALYEGISYGPWAMVPC